jgi:lipoyl(octanoyl) transferase
MRSLEEVIIRTLQAFDIKGLRFEGRSGVWTQLSENDIEIRPRKISSIGVRISRWCTMHGLALNVCGSLDNFSLINPCGFTDISMTSMELEGCTTCSEQEVGKELVKQFVTVFGYSHLKEIVV